MNNNSSDHTPTSYQQMWRRLAKVYGEGEAKAMARMVYELRYGLTMTDLLTGRDADVPSDELEQIARRLERREPVQYVLGLAEFCGRLFHVETGVLIPRPETAELCRQIVAAESQPATSDAAPAILDIGTGSGCIATTLALDVANSSVTAWDVSPVALRVASDNARRLGAKVCVERNDILQPHDDVSPQWDVIVSNPPYICNSEAADMEPNVLDYEPELALFVPDDDPLLFYSAITRYASKAIRPDGKLWMECNPLYTNQVAERLTQEGFDDVQTLDDPYGKTRFVKATRRNGKGTA